MIVLVSPGEEHWHGATKDSSFAHLSIIGQPNKMKIVEK
jgi:quercetin dioxygenase-like cupin family protein